MHSSKNIIELLELCIVKNTSSIWEEFITQYSDVIRGVYFKQEYTIKDNDVFNEFKSWFPAWLYCENKIQTAYRALRKKINEEGLSSPDEQEKYFGVYFSKIVKTGCAEFGRDKQKTFSALEARPDLADQSPAPVDDEKEQQRQIIQDTLFSLPPEQRVPFLLRYYDLVWPLEESDMKWAADKSEISVEDFKQAVESEGRSEPRKQYPLSSQFVGELLNIPPDVNGKYVTVDQRVRRVREKLKNKLRAAGEEEHPC